MNSTNHQAILYHIRKGASLRLSPDNRIASVVYPDGRDVPVNADAATELVEHNVLVEVDTNTFSAPRPVTA